MARRSPGRGCRTQPVQCLIDASLISLGRATAGEEAPTAGKDAIPDDVGRQRRGAFLIEAAIPIPTGQIPAQRRLPDCSAQRTAGSLLPRLDRQRRMRREQAAHIFRRLGKLTRGCSPPAHSIGKILSAGCAFCCDHLYAECVDRFSLPLCFRS
jgi:hypothetical protein